MPRMTTGALLWRFTTGAHLDGKVRRNERTRHVLPHYADWYWNRWSRPKRAAVRHATWIGLALTGWGLATEWFTTVIMLALAVGVSSGQVGRIVVRAVRDRRVRVREVMPSDRAVAALSPVAASDVEDALSDAMESVVDGDVQDMIAPLQLAQDRRRTRK